MTPKQMESHLQTCLEEFCKNYDKLDADDRIGAAESMNNLLLEAQRKIARARRSAIREQRASGWSLSELAARHGLSTSRIHQIETGVASRKQKQSLT